MRIAHVVATFWPHVGGMGQVALSECKMLAQRGNEVHVFTMRYPGFTYQKNTHPFAITRLDPLVVSGDAGMVPALLSKLRNFDIIHLHYPWYGGAEWVWLAKVLFKKKYVVTYHMDARPTTAVRSLIQKAYDFFLARLVLSGAEKILILDPDHFRTTKFFGKIPSEKIVELPNAIDTHEFAEKKITDSAVLKDLQGMNIMLFVGNLMPVKRLDLLLEALRIVKNKPDIADWMLLVVGGGYSEERYKKAADDLGLSHRVRFIGYSKNRSELARLYEAAVATIVPSDAESFSLVALESLAAGTPVVAANIAGVSGRIIDGSDGLLFTPGSVEDLAEKIVVLLTMPNEQRKAMGERGRSKVAEYYNLDRHVERLTAIYDEVK